MSRTDVLIALWYEQLARLKDEGNREGAYVLENCILDAQSIPLARLIVMLEERLKSARRLHSVEEEYVLENVIHDIEQEVV